jgi:hypothetical protein
VLAPDVVLIADGGGVVLAFRRPVEGREKVAAALSGLSRVVPGGVATPTWLNGGPAVRVDLAGTLDSAVSLLIEKGRITRVYAIRNPHKLAGLDGPALLSRG